MSHSAFVSTFATPSFATSFTSRNALSPMRPRTVVPATRMAVESPQETEKSTFKSLESNRAAKLDSQYRGPQGFTPYAEKVNGRLAQLGFVIGLITEIASGKPMGQQILIMFGPLTDALKALFHAVS